MARNRLGAAAAVAACLALAHALAADPAQRDTWLHLVALPLGYGHLIGGALAGRRRAPDSRTLLRALALIGLFAAWTRALQSAGLGLWLVAPLLLVSAWHIVENDLALGRAWRRDLVLPPLRWSLRDASIIAGLTLALATAALTTPSGRQWSYLVAGRALPHGGVPSLADLTAAVLLYHAFSFVGFTWERARRLGGGRGARLRRALWISHALPLAANAVLYLGLDAVHAFVASPALYLFWSVVHAVHTAARRGGVTSPREGRGCPPPTP